MDRQDLKNWIAGYERLWRTSGTDGLAAIFAADITYSPSPWAPAIDGLAALATFWDAERDGPSEGFVMNAGIIAVDGEYGIVRVRVDYADGHRWRDLWVIRLDADGRCTHFEEWPFAPDQPDGH